jgi:hypothetical protein
MPVDDTYPLQSANTSAKLVAARHSQNNLADSVNPSDKDLPKNVRVTSTRDRPGAGGMESAKGGMVMTSFQASMLQDLHTAAAGGGPAPAPASALASSTAAAAVAVTPAAAAVAGRGRGARGEGMDSPPIGTVQHVRQDGTSIHSAGLPLSDMGSPTGPNRTPQNLVDDLDPV